MAYKEIEIVTTGIKAQIEACLNALDRFEELPDEAESLGKALANAHKLCEAIQEKVENEPVADEVSE